jgi:hypothetical protein
MKCLTSPVCTECDTSTDKALGQLCTLSHNNLKISCDVSDSTALSAEVQSAWHPDSSECLT